MSPPGTRKTVDRALELLCKFSVSQPEWGVSDLSAETGIEKSIVSRLLLTLKVHGFLVQDARNRRYRLGPKIMELADGLRSDAVLHHRAIPILNSVANQTGETGILGLRSGWSCLSAEVVESRNVLRTGPRVGQETPLHAGAIGKVILAHLPEREREYYLRQSELEKFTENTIVDPAALRVALEEIRREGFAVSVAELFPGTVAASAPVFDSSGNVIASVAVDLPEMRLTDQTLALLREVLMSAAADLSSQMGYRPEEGKKVTSLHREISDSEAAGLREGCSRP